MTERRKSPIEQKAKLVSRIGELEKKIAEIDERRARKITAMVKKHRLVDLDDALLESELSAIADRYIVDGRIRTESLDHGKKK